MERFRLKGIVHPGRVNLHRVGTVELAFLTDAEAEKLWREGCEYLEPVPETIPGTVQPTAASRKKSTRKPLNP